MAEPAFHDLLRSIRGRLWLRRAADAARVSLWISAALMVAASLAPLVFGPVPPLAMVAAAGIVWGGALAWTAAHRPSAADSALWADRHLQGRSAFGTLLELGRGPPAAADAAARRHLEAWARAQLPHSARLLAERREPYRLLGPALAVLTCAALAALMQGLFPPAAPQDGRAAMAAAATASAPGGAAAPAADAAARGALQAAAADATPAPSDRQGAGAATPAAAGAPRADAPSQRPADAATAFDPLAAVDAAASAAAAGAATVAALAEGAQALEGSRSSSAGREAGDARGEGAASALSRPTAAPVPARWSGAERRRIGSGQADSDEAATYDDTASGRDDEPAPKLPAVAAAAPPTAGESTRLTPSETEYVQAWMRARSPAR
jgi:hypothetical protein